MKCKKCIHYDICEYSTLTDKEIKCKDFIYSTDYIRKTLKYYLGANEINGAIYIPKFVIKKIVNDEL